MRAFEIGKRQREQRVSCLLTFLLPACLFSHLLARFWFAYSPTALRTCVFGVVLCSWILWIYHRKWTIFIRIRNGGQLEKYAEYELTTRYLPLAGWLTDWLTAFIILSRHSSHSLAPRLKDMCEFVATAINWWILLLPRKCYTKFIHCLQTWNNEHDTNSNTTITIGTIIDNDFSYKFQTLSLHFSEIYTHLGIRKNDKQKLLK